MDQQIIDRRTQGKNKSIGNRERFMRRYKDKIREAVRRSIDGRSIQDIPGDGADVHIPRKDISEPYFHHGQGGITEHVHPGNREYVRGDKIQRPKGGGGGGGGKGQASDSGEGEDDFVFHLSKEEFMQVFFEDLGLPDMVKSAVPDIAEYKTHRAGFTSDGTPNNLSVVASMRRAIGRRIALHGGVGEQVAEEIERQIVHFATLFNELSAQKQESDTGLKYLEEIALRQKILERKGHHVPFLDPIDLRFRSRVKTPIPTSKAVMFCLMDVSGSMDEARKDLAKRFFILLYLFLKRQEYEKIDLVFIRHTEKAQEVDENTFFYSKESGGTIVSSALVLMEEIIKKRYSSPEWSIYGAQASDGDNWRNDRGRCSELLQKNILPLTRYYTFLQVAEEEQDLWEEYRALAGTTTNFAMRKATDQSQIYPVFRDFFKKKDPGERLHLTAPAP